tara:strand:- start:1949 stop:2449 length:501 start_codon:yes stop_codon:yes gene_type:complete
MAYSTIPKVRRDGSITLKDGGGVTLVVAFEEGNFSVDVPKDDQTVIRDRSTIVTIRKGDEQPITGSFSFFFRDFTDNEAGSVRDFIHKENFYSGNTSTGSTGTPFVEHYCIDIDFEVDGTLDGNTSANPKMTLSKAVCTFSLSEGDPGTYTINFTSYGGVSYTAGS